MNEFDTTLQSFWNDPLSMKEWEMKQAQSMKEWEMKQAQEDYHDHMDSLEPSQEESVRSLAQEEKEDAYVDSAGYDDDLYLERFGVRPENDPYLYGDEFMPFGGDYDQELQIFAGLDRLAARESRNKRLKTDVVLNEPTDAPKEMTFAEMFEQAEKLSLESNKKEKARRRNESVESIEEACIATLPLLPDWWAPGAFFLDQDGDACMVLPRGRWRSNDGFTQVKVDDQVVQNIPGKLELRGRPEHLFLFCYKGEWHMTSIEKQQQDDPVNPPDPSKYTLLRHGNSL